MNTLKYLFFHMKCGIYVMIRDGKLRIFAPFTNNDYRNVWADNLRIEGDGTLDTYYTQKAGEYREEQIEPDRSKWWANGNIICNELSKKEDKDKSQVWGDHFLAPLRDMLGEACREREMPDCEFFLNKRDYPQLKVNVPRGVPVEPYGFIFDKVRIFQEKSTRPSCRLNPLLTQIIILLLWNRTTAIPMKTSILLKSADSSRLPQLYPFTRRHPIDSRIFLGRPPKIGKRRVVWCFRTHLNTRRKGVKSKSKEILVTCSRKQTFESLNEHGKRTA
mmetsp:Transcript_16136/g.30716  ORF Transcript_16136/g.30716 Transcript_16136/m.30716 type:complete len:275 (-) Transcript_16136:9-833(-)